MEAVATWRAPRPGGCCARTARRFRPGPSRRPPLPAETPPPPPREGWVEVSVGHRMAAGARALHRTRPRDRLGPDAVPAAAGRGDRPLERVLAVADSGNGVASALDIRRWQFINPELTVHLQREAVGEWICLDARTVISTGGAGLATSVLSDLDGQVGARAQPCSSPAAPA